MVIVLQRAAADLAAMFWYCACIKPECDGKSQAGGGLCLAWCSLVCSDSSIVWTTALLPHRVLISGVMNPPRLLTFSILAAQTPPPALLISCSVAPLAACHNCEWAPPFLHCWRNNILLSLLEDTDVYAPFYPACSCGALNLTHHPSPSVTPIMLSLALCPSLCFYVFPGFWPVLSVIFLHCYKPPLPQPPKTMSSLHLLVPFFAPRCILVIFCAVCFGSSSASRHGHLMAGCSPPRRCCLSYCQGLALCSSPAACRTDEQMAAELHMLHFANTRTPESQFIPRPYPHLSPRLMVGWKGKEEMLKSETDFGELLFIFTLKHSFRNLDEEWK